MAYGGGGGGGSGGGGGGGGAGSGGGAAAAAAGISVGGHGVSSAYTLKIFGGRGIVAGGTTGGAPNRFDTIQYFTIGTAGNATDFG